MLTRFQNYNKVQGRSRSLVEFFISLGLKKRLMILIAYKVLFDLAIAFDTCSLQLSLESKVTHSTFIDFMHLIGTLQTQIVMTG